MTNPTPMSQLDTSSVRRLANAGNEAAQRELVNRRNERTQICGLPGATETFGRCFFGPVII